MRSVQLQLFVPEVSADTAYGTIADFARYPQICDAVRDVTVTVVDDLTTVSTWEVNFRSGILRWTEEDRLDRSGRRIDFHQLDGDIPVFEGDWAFDDVAGGTEIAFNARLDLGIPSLADALEPIAVRTLVENTVSIVGALFGIQQPHTVVATALTEPRR
jgi:ribosome-associated toxin RatA of RatAB toxin-antitoxin module